MNAEPDRALPSDDREWLARLHSEAKRLARAALRGTPPGFTLGPSDVVNEAFLRLLRGAVPAPVDPAHAVALIGRTVRNAVTDHVRKRNAARRKGERAVLDAEGPAAPAGPDEAELLDIDALLTELAADPKTEPDARAFTLHFFVGLNNAEVAQSLGVSLATVERKIRYVRGWLRSRMAP